MRSIRPEALTNSELERMMYINDGKLPDIWAKEMMKRFLAVNAEELPASESMQMPLFQEKK